MNSINWKKCAVIGAAGKMGRGIALILLIEMASLLAKEKEGSGKDEYRLTLIDVNSAALAALYEYLKTHLLKYSEKNINRLRDLYKNNPLCVSNKEIIDDFVNKGMQITHSATSIAESSEIPIFFEAVIENAEVKCDLFKKISANNKNAPYFFTNTSSIPISLLNAKADLKGRIIGFHLYNPPAVQKLLEIIPLKEGDPELYLLALSIGKSLGKTIVVSQDVAGFIGNGHFVREIGVAVDLVKQLTKNHSFEESIYMVNKITGDFLLRPMGIFQLIDYVGLDVMHNVGEIMNKHLSEHLYEDSLFKPLLANGKAGGQHTDGSQKEGFFSYRGHAMTGIYDLSQNKYIDLPNGEWQARCDRELGNLPQHYIPWSSLSRDPENKGKIETYLKELREGHSKGCQMAFEFLKKSKSIIDQLTVSKVAASKEDVETVLKNGFYHLYGSI